MKNPFLLTLAATLSAASIFAQKPAEPSRAQEDLQKQIEALTGPVPAFKGLPTPAPAAEAKSGEALPKKGKGPTQIDALEATFDQKTNQAVFIGDVVVKDPEFNVQCDKLTAFLKAAEKAKAVGEAPGPKPAKSATPAPAAAKKKGASGLQRAIAEASPGKRVTIAQEKIDPDGTVQRSVGTAEKATYDAVTGDIVLTGKPEIQQGINLVVSTAQGTKMTLNRDGRMHAEGPHRTIIVDKGDAGL